MSSVTTAERIDSIVADRLHIEQSAFGDDTLLDGETLDAESLDIVEIAEALDENLNAFVPVNEIEEMDTVGDLKAFVEAELGA
ncbi:acyl carrier protein [Halomicrobium salinisoli]|uniref:acyl carrier protein n=1 Tax=Halomicrobium salinisoli TaxID=2878391 RepID=UPI001CF0BC83|nr:phosphopantetheine-binding protein [Halomicrobium salinisoli]